MLEYITELGSEIIKIENLIKIGKILSFIIIGFLIIKIAVLILSRILRKRVSPQILMLITKGTTYTGVIIILFAVLQELGINLGILLGTAGVAGIALGFASQTSLSNLVSGLFLVAEKPFEMGDVINIGDKTGIVTSIDLLSIKVSTFDNKYMRIPNELIIKSELTNITRFPIRRLNIKLSVAYKEDLEKVKEILEKTARDNLFCLDNPEPVFIINSFGDSGIDILFGVWFAKTDYIAVNNTMLIEIKKRFDQEGIEIPFPHISIYSGTKTDPMPVSIKEGGMK